MLEVRRAAFCARLKAAREGKRLSLEEIAASTKISRSLLKGLEENDLSRWPRGIYRRSYFRDYLRAIDLLEESIVAEFARLFSDEETAFLAVAADIDSEEPAALSLTLAEGAAERFARVRRQLSAAVIDLAAVLALSALGWWVTGAEIWPSAAIAAIGYYSISTAALGRSVGLRCMENRSWRRPKKPAPATVQSEALDTLLTRMREAKGLPGQSEAAMTGGLFAVLVVGLLRTLFLR